MSDVSWQALSAAGFSIFPLQRHGKRPPRGFRWEEYQHRRPTADELARWSGDRESNAAVACGAVSGVIVLDTDSDEAEAEVRRRGIPPTPTVRTAKGRHYYFRHPGGKVRNFARKLPGCDLRGDGGYVVAAGSIHETGVVYEWERSPAELPFAEPPAWLLDLIKGEAPVAAAPPPPRSDNAYAEAALDKELAELRRAAPGGRNDQLNRAAFSLGQLVGAGALSRAAVEAHLRATALAIGLDEKEADATLRSGIEDGMQQPRTLPEPRPQRAGKGRRETGGAAAAAAAAPLRAPAQRIQARPDEAPLRAPAQRIQARPDEAPAYVLGDRGQVLAIVANAITGLKLLFPDGLAHDEFATRTVFLRPPPWAPSDDGGDWPRKLSDIDYTRFAEALQRNGVPVGVEVAAQAVEVVAREKTFHPVRAYLDGLHWDGRTRVDKWLPYYLGTEDSPYARAIGVRWLISAVARIYRPGCKADCVLILEGPQGLKKSTALRTLGYPWFTDELADLGSKDAAMQAAGAWIIELAELDSLGRSEVNRAKAYISRTVDRYRPPYGRGLVDSPRGCVFAGTVNGEAYLRDETGARRFWPIACVSIDIDALAHDRDQLWAEAVHRFRAGATWWLDDPELIRAAAEAQADRYMRDAWEAPVREYVDSCRETTVAAILEGALRKERGQWNRADEMRIAAIMSTLGWQRERRMRNGSREYFYRRLPQPAPTCPNLQTEVEAANRRAMSDA